MSNLQNLLEQQDALNAVIEKLRREERAAAISTIKNILEQHGLTPEDLGLKATRSAKKGSSVAAKYKNPETGATWSGRGLKPRWLDAALQGGRQLADFAL
jgi:DNA-binding protein H-NS